MRRLKTGINGLDVMLNGGVPEGRSVLVCGPCGTGKTLTGYHFINQGMLEREKSVFVTFEQRKNNVLHDAKLIGIDLEDMERKGSVRLIGGSFGTLNHMRQQAKAKPDDLIDEIAEVVEKMGATRVVVDSVNLFTMLFDEESNRRIVLASLIYRLEDIGCTTLFTCEVPEDSKRFSWFGFEEFMVDGVLSLQRKQFDGKLERSVTIIKMRGSSHITSVRAMQITNKGVVVYADQEPPSVRMTHHDTS